jgi:hypothetical protein
VEDIMVTLLTDTKESVLAEARVDGECLWLSGTDLEAATGWSPRPQGLCRGDVCVPLPTAREFVRTGQIDVAAVWRFLGKPIVHSDDGSVWVLGEAASDRAATLRSLQAPDFTLPDVAGRMHSLSDHRGKKVLLVSWASW